MDKKGKIIENLDSLKDNLIIHLDNLSLLIKNESISAIGLGDTSKLLTRPGIRPEKVYTFIKNNPNTVFSYLNDRIDAYLEFLRLLNKEDLLFNLFYIPMKIFNRKFHLIKKKKKV